MCIYIYDYINVCCLLYMSSYLMWICVPKTMFDPCFGWSDYPQLWKIGVTFAYVLISTFASIIIKCEKPSEDYAQVKKLMNTSHYSTTHDYQQAQKKCLAPFSQREHLQESIDLDPTLVGVETCQYGCPWFVPFNFRTSAAESLGIWPFQKQSDQQKSGSMGSAWRIHGLPIHPTSHGLLVRAKRREWMGCWGLLALSLIVMKWIMKPHSLREQHQ